MYCNIQSGFRFQESAQIEHPVLITLQSVEDTGGGGGFLEGILALKTEKQKSRIAQFTLNA